MKILREKTEILLMEYASGALDDACALLMSSYISLCPEARRFMMQCERLGGVLMEHCCEPVAMDENSIKNVLEKIDESPRPAPPLRSQREHLEACCEKTGWRRFVPGISHRAVQTAGHRYTATLVKMAPGAKIPSHFHDGAEITLILEGAFHDETGAYSTGDLIFIEEGNSSAASKTPHRPVAGQNGCLCLVLAENPVRFTGTFGPLLNALIRNARR